MSAMKMSVDRYGVHVQHARASAPAARRRAAASDMTFAALMFYDSAICHAFTPREMPYARDVA